MKLLVFLCGVLALTYADTYSELDNIDASQLLNNVRFLHAYGLCFIESGPCTPEGISVRKIIPDALATNCSKCSAKQRTLLREVGRAFQKELPDIWAKLIDKYDPKHEHVETLEKFINSDD